jgi:DNA-binding Lrp family transcriptional regulator
VGKWEAGYGNRYKFYVNYSETVKFFRIDVVSEVKKMDDTDKAIIEILKHDGRATYSNIGKRIGLSEGAVRKRIKTLVDSGAIKRFTVKVGLAEGAEAIALLSVVPSLPTSEVSKALKKLSNVETVYEITGQYDIAAIISGFNITEVNECLEKIRRLKGVANTNTMIILRSW